MPIAAGPLHAPAPSARSPIRRALAALTLTTAVIAAAACGSSKASTSRGSNAVEKPDLTVAVVPAISAAGLYVAQQRGYFTAAGLHVKIVPVASSVDAIPNLVASHGVPVSDVHYVPVPFPAMGSALAAHRVDAAFIAEPSLSAAVVGVSAVPLFDVNQGPAQNFPISGYVVTQGWMSQIPADGRRVRGRAGAGPAGRRDRPGRSGTRADPRFARQ